MIQSEKKRINWIDHLKGFAIILVIYGHNFPALESYIYTFHVPLFFFLGGFFHPEQFNFSVVKKRAKQILVPYFLWSFLLFLFWAFIGRKFGDSATSNYNISDNFVGIFIAQGDNDYMNWGIPLWFLPAIFLSFIFFGLVRKLSKKTTQIFTLLGLISIGFLIPRIFKIHLIWSLDVALVSLFFYATSFYLKGFFINKIKTNQENIALFILFFVHLFCSFYTLVKVDMYRSIYTNELLFLLNASVAICFWLLLIKKIKKMKVLSFFGKNTIIVLAVHLRMLTVIKLFLLLFFSLKTFNFTEFDKIMLVIAQLFLLYPIILFINKYLPILNGKSKTLETRN